MVVTKFAYKCLEIGAHLNCIKGASGTIVALPKIMNKCIILLFLAIGLSGCAGGGDSPVPPQSQASWGERYGEDVPSCMLYYPDDEAYVIPCPELNEYEEIEREGGSVVPL